MALRDSAQVVGAPSAGGAKVESGCCDFDVGTKLQAGPLLVISRVFRGPYKWPKIHGFYWGEKNPTYRGPITPLITIVGAHLVWIYSSDENLCRLGGHPKW